MKYNKNKMMDKEFLMDDDLILFENNNEENNKENENNEEKDSYEEFLELLEEQKNEENENEEDVSKEDISDLLSESQLDEDSIYENNINLEDEIIHLDISLVEDDIKDEPEIDVKLTEEEENEELNELELDDLDKLFDEEVEKAIEDEYIDYNIEEDEDDNLALSKEFLNLVNLEQQVIEYTQEESNIYNIEITKDNEYIIIENIFIDPIIFKKAADTDNLYHFIQNPFNSINFTNKEPIEILGILDDKLVLVTKNESYELDIENKVIKPLDNVDLEKIEVKPKAKAIEILSQL